MKRVLVFMLALLTALAAAQQGSIVIPGSKKVWTTVSDHYWDPVSRQVYPATVPPTNTQAALNRTAWAPLLRMSDVAGLGNNHAARLYARNPRTKYPPTGTRINYRVPNGVIQLPSGTRMTSYGDINFDGSVIPLVYRSYRHVVVGPMHFSKKGNTYHTLAGWVPPGTPLLVREHWARRVVLQAVWEGRHYYTPVEVDQAPASPQCGNFWLAWAPNVLPTVEAIKETTTEREIFQIENTIQEYIQIVEREEGTHTREVVVLGGTGRWSLSANTRVIPMFSTGSSFNFNIRITGDGDTVIDCGPRPDGLNLPGAENVNIGTATNNKLESDADFGTGLKQINGGPPLGGDPISTGVTRRTGGGGR